VNLIISENLFQFLYFNKKIAKSLRLLQVGDELLFLLKKGYIHDTIFV